MTTEALEILDRAQPPAAPAVAGPAETVIDNATGTITYEYKSASLMMAEANRQHQEATELVPLIDSQPMFEEAANLLQVITGDWKTLDEKRLATTKPLRDKVDAINGDFTPVIDRKKAAADVIKVGMTNYTTRVEQERVRQQQEAERVASEQRRAAAAEAQRIADAAAKQAKDAREAAERAAAQATREAEEAAQALRNQAAEAASTGDAATAEHLNNQAESVVGNASVQAQSTLLAAETEANQVLEAGKNDAEAMQQVSQMVVAAPAPVARARAAGTSQSKRYYVEITNEPKVLEYILANWATCQHLVTIETGKLNTMAQNQKERFSMPGTELRSETVISSRRK